jgi:hypothetical protein
MSKFLEWYFRDMERLRNPIPLPSELRSHTEPGNEREDYRKGLVDMVLDELPNAYLDIIQREALRGSV